MKKSISTLLFYFISVSLFSQKVYTPDWESLDKRPVPSWFEDAKFGIFIHWGLYSVPGWSPKGTYSEWYKYWLENKKLMGNGDFTGTEIYDFHTAMYGRDFTYADFAPMFKAMSYDANEWAKLFERAGARYAVLTTKHHDGFALWLVERYAVVVDPELHKEVRDRYYALDIEPYGGFVNPEYELVEKDGRIVDVKISYPADYVGQMLGYAKDYSFLPNIN